MRAVRTTLWSASMLLVLTAASLRAQDLASFEKRTTVRKLDNGLTVIILERHEAPVFSYATVVNAGSTQEVTGITGLAHMFEHMAFKGSQNIGTTNYADEKAALDKVEAAYQAYDTERHKTVGHDDAKVKELEKAWRDAMATADKYVVPNEFSKIVDEAGGAGMNAGTQADRTTYFFSLPSNRFELWAFLESERFYDPVFREFYKERDVVQEERRMRYESSPFGRLLLQFTTAAFVAHPYGTPAIGWPSDLTSFSATDAKNFFNEYYVPANMVIAIVGDVNPAEAMPVIEKYFGRLPKKPLPEALRTVEPPQNAERTVVIHETAQPIYLEGYHRPAATDPDNAAYDTMSILLSAGRTSRLYRSIVRDKKLAVQASGFSGFPGQKYPSLFTFIGVPTPQHKATELEDPIHAELERLKTQDVTPEELQSVKTRVKAGLLRQLDSNQGMALQLATAQTLFGDWRELFRSVDKINAVTAADIRRVANSTFTPENRTVAYIESNKPAATAPKGDSK
ncbi:MAG TPA: pitrilysin family protein [Thermoanaerobaculia bacterium]|nr:pitrilysin family protein [Thermoanaerobaculia bacterium]